MKHLYKVTELGFRMVRAARRKAKASIPSMIIDATGPGSTSQLIMLLNLHKPFNAGNRCNLANKCSWIWLKQDTQISSWFFVYIIMDRWPILWWFLFPGKKSHSCFMVMTMTTANYPEKFTPDYTTSNSTTELFYATSSSYMSCTHR